MPRSKQVWSQLGAIKTNIDVKPAVFEKHENNGFEQVLKVRTIFVLIMIFHK